MAGPVGVKELSPRLIEALIGVSSEKVALGLEQIGGQALAAIGIVERQGGAERWDGDSLLDGGRDCVSPCGPLMR